MIAYAHGAETLEEDCAVDGVAIPEQVSWCFLPRKRFGQLTGDPLGRGTRCNVDPNEIAVGNPNNDEPVQQPEADRRHNKEVDRRYIRCMVTQKGAPGLRGWP